MMMGHCTPREAEEFFAKMGGMTPSVSTLQRLTQSCIASEWPASVPPRTSVSASVSLDGDGGARGVLARGLLRHSLLRQG